MSMGEVFNQARINRCFEIERNIMSAWQKSNSFQYVVRATQPVEGMFINELRTQYFQVGVGDQVSEIPFIDMLVVFSIIEQETAALSSRPKSSASKFRVQYQIKTEFSDIEAVRLLTGMQIETPFDKGKHLRLQEVRTPIDPLTSDREQ